MPKVELLLPAGSLENLKTAYLYGADAVYCGLPSLSLRAKAGFTLEELIDGVKFAHNMGKKIYIALNLLAKNSDFENLPSAIDLIKTLSPDGLIIADAGVFSVVRETLPNMHITISTQANISNSAAVRFWQKAGANRIVLARECSFEDLVKIREENKDIEIECFVHGAMCMAVSGRCLISNFLSNRGANQGECAQSCRWDFRLYALEEKTRKNEIFEIFEEDGYSHILSSKDLCLMPVLDKYLQIGVNSFKIEGRHKNAFYIASIARAYRLFIDEYNKFGRVNYLKFLEMVNSVKNRGLTLGFHNGQVSDLSCDYESTKSMGNYQFAGIVRQNAGNYIIFEVRNTLDLGDKLEFLDSTSSQNIEITLSKIIDAKNDKEIDRASAGQGFCIKIAEKKLKNITERTVAKIKCKADDGNRILEREKDFGREICEA